MALPPVNGPDLPKPDNPSGPIPQNAGPIPNNAGAPNGNSNAGPAANAPAWVIVIGAMFGGVTLIGFMAFAYSSTIYPSIVCNSPILFAAIFALGVGLATAFLGGAAAANGNIHVAGTPLGIGVGGGIAAVVIVFALFMVLAPKGCPSNDATLKILDIPTIVDARPDSFVWTRRIDNDGVGTYEKELILNGLPAFEIKFYGQGKQSCLLSVTMAEDITQEITVQAQRVIYGRPVTFKNIVLRYRPVLPRAPTSTNAVKKTKEFPNQCLEHNAAAISDKVIISLNQLGNKIAFATDYIAEAHQVRGLKQFALQTPTLFTSTAFAGDIHPPFAQLKSNILGGNDNERVAARRYLAGYFAHYKDQVLKVVFEEAGTADPILLADLLSALTDSISNVDPKMAPGQGIDPGIERNFAAPPTTYTDLISGHEKAIVQLTAHNDQDVQRQARRLIQRYPFDGYLPVYDRIIDRVTQDECHGGLASAADQAILYSGIFFYYNRIVEKNFAPRLSPEAAAEAAAQAEKVLNYAKCMEVGLKVDAALVLYGLALIYREDGGESFQQQAQKTATRFLKFLGPTQEQYYLQSHLNLMKSLAGSIN